MDFDELSRQRIDYQELPNGAGLRAVLTVSLPNGVIKRYAETLRASDLVGDIEVGSAEWDRAQLQRDFDRVSSHPAFAKNFPTFDRFWAFAQKNHALSHEFTGAFGSLAKSGFKKSYTETWRKDPALRRIFPTADDWWTFALRQPVHGTTGGIFSNTHALEQFGDLAKLGAEVALPQMLNLIVPGSGVIASAALIASKAVPVAKKLLSNKVMAKAAGKLAQDARDASGIDKAAAVATSGVLGVASKLGNASHAAEHGNPRLATALTHQAITDAQMLTSSPAAARDLLEIANRKRTSAHAIASRKPKPKREAIVTRGPKVDVLKAARAGALRSNQPGDVSPETLKRAALEGRVFWLA